MPSGTPLRFWKKTATKAQAPIFSGLHSRCLGLFTFVTAAPDSQARKSRLNDLAIDLSTIGYPTRPGFWYVLGWEQGKFFLAAAPRYPACLAVA
jgi:hypothetical protein